MDNPREWAQQRIAQLADSLDEADIIEFMDLRQQVSRAHRFANNPRMSVPSLDRIKKWQSDRAYMIRLLRRNPKLDEWIGPEKRAREARYGEE